MEYTPTENDIEFTQYLMPNGRKTTVWIERPAPIVAKARMIMAAGYRFECEMLNDHKTISLTIADDEKEEDVAIRVVSNGPEVPKAIDEMISEFEL